MSKLFSKLGMGEKTARNFITILLIAAGGATEHFDLCLVRSGQLFYDCKLSHNMPPVFYALVTLNVSLYVPTAPAFVKPSTRISTLDVSIVPVAVVFDRSATARRLDELRLSSTSLVARMRTVSECVTSSAWYSSGSPV